MTFVSNNFCFERPCDRGLMTRNTHTDRGGVVFHLTRGSVASSGFVLQTIIPRNSGTGKILSPSEQSLFLSFTSVRGKRIGIDSDGVTGIRI